MLTKPGVSYIYISSISLANLEKCLSSALTCCHLLSFIYPRSQHSEYLRMFEREPAVDIAAVSTSLQDKEAKHCYFYFRIIYFVCYFSVNVKLLLKRLQGFTSMNSLWTYLEVGVIICSMNCLWTYLEVGSSFDFRVKMSIEPPYPG
ncbi:hypothetical protein QQ045_028086 [Rhodiola kirilowii]